MEKINNLLKSIQKAFIDEFSSVKLAIVLFVFLAASTLIGTVLPEEPMVGMEKLINKYGVENYRLLKSLGFTDVFHSWWYFALLTMLGMNIVTASFVKVFPRAKNAFLWPVEIKTEGIKNLPINCEVNLSNELSLKKIQNELNKFGYKSKLINESKIVAMKGNWHKLGASVTHVGIMTLLIGCTITVLTGFNGMAQVQEGEGFYLADLGQSTTQVKSIEKNNWLAPISKMPLWFGRIPPTLIKVNKTWREDYKSGQPKQWFSELSVFDENKNELIKKTIYVNSPLEFMGLDVYQSNWGRFLNIAFNGEEITLPLENVQGHEGVVLPLSEDVGLKFLLRDLDQSDYVSPKDQRMLEVYSVSSDNTRERLLGKIFQHNKLKVGPIDISFLDVQTLTGLQFKSNPGSVLIYPGLFFIILGVFIAFGSKKQIWVAIDTNSNRILIGGNSDRTKGKFFEEFEKLIKGLV